MGGLTPTCTVLVLVALYNQVVADCDDAYTCADCESVDPGAAAGCFWCQNDRAPLCMESGYETTCDFFLAGTRHPPAACPAPTPACHQYSASCDICIDNSPGAGLDCKWCVMTGTFNIEGCIKSSEDICDTGTTLTECPTECMDPPIDSGNIYVSHSVGDDNGPCCCGGVGSPCKSIKCGLSQGARAPIATSVWIEDGSYMETDLTFPNNIYGLTVRSTTRHGVVVFPPAEGGRIFSFEAGMNTSCELNGVILRDGTSPSGGCARLYRASPTIRDVIFDNCTASVSTDGPSVALSTGRFGGGAYLFESAAEFHDCQFVNAVMEGNYVFKGIGIYSLFSAVKAYRCVFEGTVVNNDPSVNSNYGGGVMVDGPLERDERGVAHIINCTFRNNSVVTTVLTRGLGVFVSNIAAVQVVGCLFEDNYIYAPVASGAGLAVTTSGINIRDTTFRGNTVHCTSDAYGGALDISFAAIASRLYPGVTNCVFENNAAIAEETGDDTRSQGGAFYMDTSSVEFPIVGCTFTNNRVGGRVYAVGGGLAVLGVPVLLLDSVFTGNSAISSIGDARGGAINLDSPPLPDLSHIDGCSFNSNYVETALSESGLHYAKPGGGALYGSLGASPTVSMSSFDSNRVRCGNVDECYGGGVAFQGTKGTRDPAIQGCNFTNNYLHGKNLAFGGGIGVASSYSLSVYDSLFDSNTVVGSTTVPSVWFAVGGGIGSFGAPTDIKRCVVRNSFVSGYRAAGGGIGLIANSGVYFLITVEESVIIENTMESHSYQSSDCVGGGFAGFTVRGALIDTRIEGNYGYSTVGSTCFGGGVALGNTDLEPFLLRSTTITGNTGQSTGGGLVFLAATIHLELTRICGNIPTNQVYCGGVSCIVTGDSGYHMSSTSDDIASNICPETIPGECTSICYGHGSCNYDECSCDPGYYGELCDQECNGGATPMCSGHGVCDSGPLSTGACDCESGFFGLGCALACPNNCSYSSVGGICDSGEAGSGQCSCPSTNFGPDCSEECPGTIELPGKVKAACYANGACDAGANGTGSCTCTGAYGGVDCFDCQPGFGGSGCHIPCPGESHDCSGHGTCDSGRSGNGKCASCDPGFFGLDCGNECPGGAANPCHGHGTCDDGPTGTGVCVCESTRWDRDLDCADCIDHYGPLCSLECPRATPGGPVCGGDARGSCDSGTAGNGTCVCTQGVVGEFCEVDCPGFLVADVCSGHGECVNDGSCVCANGFSGAACQTSSVDGLAESDSGGNIGGAVAVGIILPLVLIFAFLVAFYVWYNQLFCFAAYVDDDGATAKHVHGDDGQMKTYVHRLLNQRNTRHIGSGGAADVFKVKLDNGTWVAIKRLKTRLPSEMAEFHQELSILSSFMAGEGHPNVISLLFFCDEPPCIGMELCEGGSVASVVMGGKKLSEADKLRFVMDTARGMNFLHEHKIIHNDLKPDNLLLTKEGVVKITDFGISRTAGGDDADTEIVEISGTVQYMAPERFVAKSFDYFAADVYSFGICMWAVWERKRPYVDTEALTTRLMSGEKVKRPPVPTDCDIMYRDLMCRCWAEEPAQRPLFAEIINIFDNYGDENSVDSFIAPRKSMALAPEEDLDSFAQSSLPSAPSEANLDSVANLNSAVNLNTTASPRVEDN